MEKLEKKLESLTFGTELEYEGLGIRAAAKAVARNVLGGRAVELGGSYAEWRVGDWFFRRDGSLEGGPDGSVEVVTPPLRYEDLPVLQQVVECLRESGAATPASTSQHVHIGTGGWTWGQRAAFAKIWARQEPLVLAAVQTLPSRLEHFTRPMEGRFLEALNALQGGVTSERLNRAWFGEYNPNPRHYDSERYHALNLNNLWRDSGTIEIRAFNGTADPDEVRAHIVLCLAMAAQARTARSASAKKVREFDPGHSKYQMRTLMINLGMIGPDFAQDRKVLLAHTAGDASWRMAVSHTNTTPHYAGMYW